MKLVPIPGLNGRPMLWVNPERIAAVTRLDYDTGKSVQLRAELKVEGMPLQRVDLGTFASVELADQAWVAFMNRLQG